MKRDSLRGVIEIDRAITELEYKLSFYQQVEKFTVMGGFAMELQNYEEPSQIGRTFRAVRSAICDLLASQIKDCKRELEKLGVEA